jgi:hypothetical protein
MENKTIWNKISLVRLGADRRLRFAVDASVQASMPLAVKLVMTLQWS